MRQLQAFKAGQAAQKSPDAPRLKAIEDYLRIVQEASHVGTVVDVSSAADSATAAAASAAAAAASATAAASSAAAALVSKLAAAASATAAATSASAAATSATSAASSATSATASATSATASASAAAASATAAAASATAAAASAAAAAASAAAIKITVVATRSAMALLNTTTYQGAYLQETGREGVFRWNGSNMSAFVTLDPAQGVYVAKSTDATGASGAWVRDLPSFSVTCMWFGAVGDGNVTNMVADTYACQYAISFSSSTSIPIIEREKRTYMIDGYKGANGSWTSGVQEAGGLWLKNKASICGAGRGVTTFKNGADNWRCVFNIQDASDRVRLTDLTIDGDVDNHHPMVLGGGDPGDDPGGTTTSTTGAIRGEGIITWNNGTIDWFEFGSLEIKNTGHYGIGLQASIINGGIIDGMRFENIGGDCIDGKYVELIADHTLGNHKKMMIWTNIHSVDGCGHNYPGKYSADGHDVQTVLDIPRGVIVSNVQIYGLDTYDAGQQGNDGVRFRAQVDAITITTNRLGSEGSMGQNIKIFSAKAAGVGSATVKRIRGVVINSDHVSVSNFFVDGAFSGLDVSASADDVPVGVNVSNGVIQNCTGAGTDAKGISIPASTEDCNFSNITVDGCEIGILLSGSASASDRTKFSNISVLNNLVGVSANALNLSRTQWSNITFHGNTVDCDSTFAQQIGTSSVAGWSCLHGEDVVVMKDRQAFFDSAAIANDAGWTGDNAWVGGQRFFAADASSGITAELARVGLRATGSSGADFMYEIQTATNAAGAKFAVARFQDVYAQFLVPVLLPVYTTGTLPTSNPAGQRAQVSNALAPAFGVQVAGAGTVKTPVYSDGSGGAAPAGWIAG